MSLLKEQSLGAGYVRFSPGGVNEYMKTGVDGRAGMLNWIHDSTGIGFLLHMTTTVNTADGYGPIGIGVDGKGTGITVRNKKSGIGINVQHASTVDQPNAYGLAVAHDSAVAPAIYCEQRIGATKPLMQLVSYDTNDSTWMLLFSGATGDAGGVRSNSGQLRWKKNVVVDGSRFVARGFDGTPDTNSDFVYMDKTGLEFAAYSGTVSTWWTSMIKPSGTVLNFQIGDTGGAGGTSMETVIALGHGGAGFKRLGFFGKTPVSKRAGWTTATGTATRTTFDTTSVTLPQLAEHVKALIDDLHATAGYGLLTT